MDLLDPRPVLIVEDSDTFREVLRYGLHARYPGVRILEAPTAAEGSRLALEHRPALILMDVQLPDGNGLHLTRKIKKALPHVAVVVCTTHDLPEHRAAALASGAAHFVCKDRLAEAGFMELVGDLLELRTGERGASGGAIAPASAASVAFETQGPKGRRDSGNGTAARTTRPRGGTIHG